MTKLLIQGIEIETTGVAVGRIQTAFENENIKGCDVKIDHTPNVDAEIALPPLCLFNSDGTPCQVAYEYLISVCRVLNNIGCRINSHCGLHVHVGIRPLDETQAQSHNWTGNSISTFHNTRRYYTEGLEDEISAVVWYDVTYRYSRQQHLINRILPPSRTDNRYCNPINLNNFDNLNANDATIEGLKRLTRGKFSTINFETWSRGTVEFRQHSGTIEAEKIMSWCKLIRTIVNWSITDRVENGTGSTTETTPENPFRNGSRVGVQYSLMRRLAGATTREIMDATGCSEQRVRAAVSEIRNRVGHGSVVTNTMQANGRRYGDGTDFTSYEVLHEITVENSGAVMIPENRIGNASIWSNVDDDDFEYWQNRTTDLYPN